MAIRRLAAGDFSARSSESSRNELAQLARDFNLLAMMFEKIRPYVRRAGPESLSGLLGEVALLTKLVVDLHQLSLSDSRAVSYRKAKLDLVPLLERSLNGLADRFQIKTLRLASSCRRLSRYSAMLSV